MSKHGLVNNFESYIHTKADITDPLFGRVFQRNPIRKPYDTNKARELLSRLADSMSSTIDESSDVAAGLTFFGQFVDHDITLDTTSALGQAINVHTVRNIRTPALDLDCVFGSGHEASRYSYSALHGGYLLYGTQNNASDLARNHEGTALIGDFRNDENGIVSQVQGLFIQFYNLVLKNLKSGNAREFAVNADLSEDPIKLATAITRWHYQWLVLNEFLPAFVDQDVLKNVLHTLRHGRLPEPFHAKSPVIPIEFSVAAYRFGHATVQNRYAMNGDHSVDLFDQGDGSEGLPAFGPKQPRHNLSFSQFFDGPDGPSSQKARPIGTKLAEELFRLPVAENMEIKGDKGLVIPGKEAISLAHRNIYRDRFSFGLASGQQAAGALGFTPLDRDEATRTAGIDKIPLWYYCLQEAQESGTGKLGQVGGTIVATVLARLLVLDPTSIWYKPGWAPSFGVQNGEFSIGHMAKWVEDNHGDIDFWEELYCPNVKVKSWES